MVDNYELTVQLTRKELEVHKPVVVDYVAVHVALGEEVLVARSGRDGGAGRGNFGGSNYWSKYNSNS